MEPWMVATSLIFAYLVLTLILGVVANRKLAVDMEDFLLYGRQAGFVVLYLTLVSTYYSAFAFLGSSGFFSPTAWASGQPVPGPRRPVSSPTRWAVGSGRWASASDTSHRQICWPISTKAK